MASKSISKKQAVDLLRDAFNIVSAFTDLQVKSLGKKTVEVSELERLKDLTTEIIFKREEMRLASVRSGRVS